MKEIVLKLIIDDIKISIIANCLQTVGVSSNSIYLNNYLAIFYLMGIEEKEDMKDQYYQFLEAYPEDQNIIEYASVVFDKLNL